jgi:tape measure domain-containing protein
MAGSSTVVELLIRARDLASNTIDRVRGAVGGLADQARAALEPLRSFSGLIGGAIGLGGASELIKRADAFDNLANQIKVATSSEQEYRESLEAVEAIATRSLSDLDSTARLYAKVNQNAEALGISQAQVADVTETVAKGMQLSGSAASATAAATQQFTQALASGTLRGDEFNSVMDASPALMKAIADGLGVAVGELRAMAEAGQLTANRVVQGLLSQKDAINELYGKITVTVEQRLSQLSNAATLFVGKLNEQYGATRSLGDGLQFLANNLDAVAGLMGAAFAASVAKGAQSTYQFVAASIAARDAARQQALAAQQQTAANVAAAQGHVAAAQAAYNRAVAEQRAAQAQLLALETIAGLFASEEALALARAQSTAAAAAATAATQRYTAAQAALAAAQGPAAASASLFARAMGVLTGPTGLILTAVASFGLLYSAFSKQKPTVDSLTQSTEQYAESLEKLNGAQLAGQLLDLNKAIADQEDVIKRARFAARDLNETYTETGETIKTSRAGTDDYIRAQSDLADQTVKLNDLQAKRAALLERQAAAQREASDGDMAAVTAYNQQITALDKLAGSLGEREKYLKKINDAEIAQTQALLDKAKALGDAATAEKLAIQIAGQRAKAAEQTAALARAEAVAEDAKVAALEKVSELQGKLTPQQQESLAMARESAIAKRAEASAAALLADKLKAEADSQQIGIAAKERAIQRTGQIAAASSGYVSALESVANAQLSGLRAEIDLAKAKGQTWLAQQKTVDLAKLEAQWAKALADAKQADIAAQRASTEAQIAGLQAKNDNTEATLKQIAALQLQLVALGKQAEAEQLAAQAKALSAAQATKATDAEREHARASEESAQSSEKAADANKDQEKSYTLLEDAATGALRALSGLSKGMNDLLSASLGLQDIGKVFGSQWTGELGKLKLALNQTEGAIKHNTTAGGVLSGAFLTNANAANAARKSYLEQAIAAESLGAELAALSGDANANALNIGDMVAAAEAAKAGLGLLDQSRLDKLQGEIDAANDKLRQMQDEAQSAQDRIAELNAEIAAERGDTAAADQLQLELDRKRALAEVDKNLAAAQAANNTALIALYEEQKRKLQELYEIKQRNLDADIRASENDNKTNRQGGTGDGATASAPSATSQPSVPSATAPGGGNITVNVSANNARLLDSRFVEDLARQMTPVLGNIQRRLS